MRQRILTNWTLMRVFYLAIGCALIFQSVGSKEWIGIVIGSYFASMGLLAYGCAAGRCSVDRRPARGPRKQLNNASEVDFEEVRID